MKHLFFYGVMVGFMLGNEASAQTKKDLYKATYSSNFKIGNPAYATMIQEVWKDWDDNLLDRHDYFADTLAMYFSDGTMMKGKAANMEAAKKYRGGMTKVSSTLHAWVPIHSNDKKEDAVCLWGLEENTMADGKVERKALHEVWWFNKDGKISIMRQWTAVPTAPVPAK